MEKQKSNNKKLRKVIPREAFLKKELGNRQNNLDIKRQDKRVKQIDGSDYAIIRIRAEGDCFFKLLLNDVDI